MFVCFSIPRFLILTSDQQGAGVCGPAPEGTPGTRLLAPESSAGFGRIKDVLAH